MATRAFLLPLSFLFMCFLSPRLSSALYEDQVGIVDWHHQYLGKVNHAVFHTQKAGRKRVVVSTEENAIASLDLRRGGIFWRHLLKGNDQIDHIDIALGKYVVTLSSGGSILRAWNLPDGQMVWESVLQTSIPSKSLLHVPESSTGDKNSLLLVFGGGWLHAISGIDGDVVWSKDLSPESVQIQQIYQHSREGIVYAVGFGGSSQVDIYEISSGAGHLLKHQTAIYSGKFSRDFLFIHKELLVALDSTKSKIVLVNFQGGEITFHETYISDLVHDFSGEALILPLKFADMFVLTLPSCTVIIKVKSGKEVLMIERIGNPASVSDALFLSEGKQAFATVHHTNNHVHITVKLESDLAKEVLKESIEMDHQRGHVQKVFINNYIRTDRSHGFRALLVMEDHSLQLVQQGEVVWNREDGLASIVDSTVSELPVEKDGVSVSKVEHSLFEWLKGHFLKLKGTLMLASPDDLAAIQDMRLRNSEKNKMTRDHNGFRKLVIVLTRAGKVLALHTGDGRVVWSILLSSICGRQACQNPTWLNIHQWQVPHHHALDENPSVFIVGRCGENSDSKGILSVIDSYTGKEISSWKVSHSISQVMPLPLKDPKEQHLHLIIDSNNDVHLYPKSFDSLDTFLPELGNVYWYSIDRKNDIIRGHALNEKCHLDESDEYCFGTRNIWSIVLPSDTERIITTTRRQLNEVVHTQAKVLGDQDVMYKYISNNVLFVATASPKAAGEIGSAAPEEARLVVYLIDVVTGRVIHRVTHHGSQGPVHAVFSEHWVAYHYFNLRAHRYEMSVIEIYDESRAGNKDVLKLVLGKHNLTSPISSYSLPEVVVKSQSYFFTHSVKTIAVTLTAKGITSKQVLIGTIGDQVLALDKRFLDPRRSLTPTQSEKEEGIIPLTESLPIIPQSYVTHSLQVEGLRKIVTIPAKLESTTLIFSYGIDLFFTRIAPSRTYDSLTEDFNYALLLITIFALVAAIFVTWVLSEQKELRDKWR